MRRICLRWTKEEAGCTADLFEDIDRVVDMGLCLCLFVVNECKEEVKKEKDEERKERDGCCRWVI